MAKKKKRKANNTEVWTEEQYEEYLKSLYGMEFIAGFTEGGVPYGTFSDESVDMDEENISKNRTFDTEDDLPF